VKIGVNDLTRELVRTEAAVLTHLRSLDLDPIRPPRLLHSGPWAEGTELLVVEALPVWGVAPDSATEADAMRIDAMRAVASAEGVDSDRSALDTYLSSLEARVGKLGDGPTPNVLRTVLQQVRGAGRALPIGAWHGDWNAGNLAIRDGRVLMWDWERYTTGVPVGFDALHYELTRAYVPKVRSASAAAAHVRTRAAEILRPFGIEPADAATVWRLYATEIATRFLGDGQETAQSDLGRVAGWIGEAVPDAVG
jgi:hypothetical protein